MIKFSIIIPFYNEEKYIAKCLDSVFNQNFKRSDFEVILIDDGSTDKSKEIASRYDVKILSTKVKRFNAGGARNLGLDIAKGDYILLLDADDFLYDNNVLKDLASQINGQDIVFVKLKRIEGQKETIIEENPKLSIDEQISNSNNFCLTLKCFRRDLVKDIRYKQNCYHEDISFVMELMCKAKTALYFNGLYQVYFRDGSATTDDYSIRKALDFTEQTLEYLYLADKYKNRRNPLKKRINKEHYENKLKKLYDWALNEKRLNYKDFLK